MEKMELSEALKANASVLEELVASLEAKDKIYIRILTYELEDEYVSFRIFSQGKWDIKL